MAHQVKESGFAHKSHEHIITCKHAFDIYIYIYYPSISYIFYFFVFFVLCVYACVPLSSISGSRQSQLELLPFGDSLREWAHRQLRCLKSVGVVCLYKSGFYLSLIANANLSHGRVLH